MTGDDPEIGKRKTARKTKEAAEAAAGLTIADRLTRRARTQTVDLLFEDEDGEFTIVLKAPTRKELDVLIVLQLDLQKLDMQEAASEALFHMLDDLSIDESLDYAYWKEGDYSMDDFIQIFAKLFTAIADQVQEVQTFRENG